VNKVHKRIGLFAGLTALLFVGSAHAQYDCPTVTPQKLTVPDNVNPETGHTFDVYKANGICWAAAQAFVDGLPDKEVVVGSRTILVSPYLATITSSSENTWIVDKLLKEALKVATTSTSLSQSQVWVGGSQLTGSAEPGSGWRWENNEGPFPGVNGGTVYTNWASVEGEPNDTGSGDGNENWLTLGRYPTNLYGWNDEGAAVGSIGGFIVEYDTPRTAAECTGTETSTEACTTINGQTLTFPAGTFQPGDTIQFTAYEFNDPRVGPDGKCTVNPGPLTLFTDTVAFGTESQLKIPAYLCGSPKFVVVKVNSEDLTITKGTVFVENETTEKVLPDNLYKCFDPILGNPAVNTLYAPDPQYQDVVVWQTTNPENMRFENLYVGNPDYMGAATEATNGCGSTTAKVRGASYFVVGMHIDFGNAAYDYASSPLQNYQQFVFLTEYKLELLRKSVDEARAYGSIKKPDWQAMSSQLKNAISKLGAGDPAGALSSMQQFVFKVNSSSYSEPTGPYVGFNFNGDHLMRGENIVFTLRVKVVPYKPVP
jgi:hypothetical protein